MTGAHVDQHIGAYGALLYLHGTLLGRNSPYAGFRAQDEPRQRNQSHSAAKNASAGSSEKSGRPALAKTTLAPVFTFPFPSYPFSGSPRPPPGGSPTARPPPGPQDERQAPA